MMDSDKEEVDPGTSNGHNEIADEKDDRDVILVANVIEASKDGEVVKYTVQTKEVCTFDHF